MPETFISLTQDWADSLKDSDSVKGALRYLLENACGRENAKPVGQILRAINEGSGRRPLTAHWFQIEVVAPSRRNNCFIASGPNGYFLITSREDAQVMIDFYDNRIAAETANRDKLEDLLSQIL